jgi:large subunit ribosomal protein L10
MGPSELDRLAEMPTREQALALLMATMKAPVTKLAMTLNAVPGKLVRTVEAVRQQKAAV